MVLPFAINKLKNINKPSHSWLSLEKNARTTARSKINRISNNVGKLKELSMVKTHEVKLKNEK